MADDGAAAWAVEHGGDIVHVAIRAHDAEEWAGDGPVDVVPLYRSPTLTDAEREAIVAAVAFFSRGYGTAADTLRALLDRTG